MFLTHLRFVWHNIQFYFARFCFFAFFVPSEEAKYFYLTKIKGMEGVKARAHLQFQMDERNKHREAKQHSTAFGVFVILLIVARMKHKDDEYAGMVAAVQTYAIAFLAQPTRIRAPFLNEGKEITEIKDMQYQLFRIKTLKSLIDAFSLSPETREAVNFTLACVPRTRSNVARSVIHKTPNFDALFENKHALVTDHRLRDNLIRDIPYILADMGLFDVKEAQDLFDKKNNELYRTPFPAPSQSTNEAEESKT